MRRLAGVVQTIALAAAGSVPAAGLMTTSAGRVGTAPAGATPAASLSATPSV